MDTVMRTQVDRVEGCGEEAKHGVFERLWFAREVYTVRLCDGSDD